MQSFKQTNVIFQTIILLSTAIVVRTKIHTSRKRLSHKTNKSSHSKFSKQEMTAFKKVALMQIGFTLTLSKIFNNIVLVCIKIL